MLKTKNIVIIIVTGIILVFIYMYFIKPSSTPDNLISVTSTVPDTMASIGDSSVARDFLTLLLNVKNIKLDDTIFSDNAFTSLRDSSITLTADGTEGRANPFAPLGSDNIVPVTQLIPQNTIITPTTPVIPATPVTPVTPVTPNTTPPKKP